MNRLMQKIKAHDMVCWVVAIVVLVCGMIAPKSGKFVLWDEGFDILIFWIATLYVIFKVLSNWKRNTKKNQRIGILAVVGLILFSLLVTKNLVVDLVVGTQETTLTQVSTSQYRSAKGLASTHYYLHGTDENNEKQRFEISSKEYESMKHANHVRVDYYPNTDRVQSLTKIS